MRGTGTLLLFLFLSMLLLTLGTVLAGFAQTEDKKTAQNEANDFQLDVDQLKDKRHWTLVNLEPYYISSELDLLCARPSMANIASLRKDQPHANTFISVFVNEIGREAMFSNPSRKFPEGAVIVKKKFEPYAENPRSAFDQAQTTKLVKAPPPSAWPAVYLKDHFDPYSEKKSEVLLYTVMIKRQSGYNPKAGDWEFAVVSADGRMQASGKLGNCMSCHVTRPNTDFIFRSYVTVARTTASK
jgi:hypothetical protein